jgi:hypothetical protein
MADPSGKSPSGAREPPRRYYALFPPQGELLELYRRGELKAIIAFFQQEFANTGFRHLAGTSFDVSLPAPRWRFVGDLPGKGGAAAGAAKPDVGKVAPGELDLSRLLLAYEFDDPRWGPEFLAFLEKWLVGVEKPIVGVDLRLDFAEHWCPSEATNPIFGTHRDAGRLIDLDGLARHGCTGERVNVVVVDQGLDAALTPNFGGGWISGGGPPGTTKRGHGAMVARNVLHAAPEARIFDCRIVPDRIGTIGHFMSDAQAAVQQMLIDIELQRSLGYWREPWVFVNAWGLFSRSQDPEGNYSANPLHPINLLMDFIDGRGHDVVFAAGNCGQFCPSPRCDWDAGPGRTIVGANSHPKVLTVGAVRTDGLWLGYSSQGPGQEELSPDDPERAGEKPDLCAPSQFCEDADAHTFSTGSSAACGVAAGVVAAIRTACPPSALSPAQLREALRRTARKPSGPPWDDRLGYGVLDAAAAADRATKVCPAGVAA